MKKSLNSTLIIITIAFVGSSFFTSCSKDKNEPATTSVPLIATSMSYNENGVLEDIISYQYDKNRRLTKMTYKDGSYDLVEYSGSTLTLKNYEDEKLDFAAVAKLNNQGLCISVTSDDEDSTLDTYEYDSNGYRKSITYDSDSWVYTETFTVSGENYVMINSIEKSKTTKSATIKECDLLKRSAFFTNLSDRFASKTTLKSAAWEYTDETDYQFYTDKTNTIEYENIGISFLGKQNKNPIKQETRTSTNESDTNSYTKTYTYEYDTKGRTTKQIVNTGSYTIYTYVD